MKELSIEEKAKRYDEALKYAKIYYTSGDEDMKMMMKTCFPVLVEDSEDERIMKALIDGFKRYDDGSLFNGCLVREILAWIEKQGEHADFLNKIQIGDKVTCNEDGVLVNISQLNRVAKPAEEYNITGIGSKNAQGKLGEMIKNLKSVNEMKVEPKFNAGDFVRSKYNKAVVLRIEEVCNDVYKTECGGYIRIEFQDDWELMEEKSAWSEEDEEIIRSLLDIIYECHSYGKCALKLNEYSKLCDWLKSLRPQNRWKPSDEQIEALLKLEEMHVLEHEKNQENAHLYMMVKSIREQLLKLREE